MPKPRASKGRGKGKSSASGPEFSSEGYMQYPSIQKYESDIDLRTLDNSTDTMWGNIIPLYFTAQNGFGTDVQRQGAPGAPKSKLPQVNRRIIHEKKTKVHLVSDHHTDHEENFATKAEILETLTERLTSAAATNDDKEPVYGVIAVGHMCQFYKMMPGETEPEDLTGGRTLHFLHDESEITEFLQDIAEMTC
ncbi:hypothetical protein S40285_09935 [Stachybotrys chlorohalonatus IBT 40285]|uniref:Uncharacterized protein n=1 Tax=Stachybotrys chlorohalonatus (strain IBT 40285) TaxID=1283841 RepID=A0A084QHF5_STAC4|nr:hypothetical protein S40285_09935 [Stachybotrys chlorohalonata IBT 40285]